MGTTSLDVFDFGLLLQALAQSSKVGTLRVVSGTREKYIHIDRGRVEAVYTRRSRFRICRILYNMHVVEMEDLRSVLEEGSGADGKPLGEVLVEKGLVSEADLQAALHYQMLEELVEVFHWKDLTYEFFGGPPEKAVGPSIRELTRVGGGSDADSVLLEVTKILDDIENFNRTTPSLKDVYEAGVDARSYVEREGLPAHVAGLIELIDGVRDIGEVLREMRLNRFEVMEILRRMREEGLTRPKNALELLMLAENRRDSLPPKKLIRLYERVAELGLDGFDLSLRLAELYEKTGEREKAAACYLEHAGRMSAEGEAEKARAAAEKAVALVPGSPAARHRLSRILLDLDLEEEAARELQRIAGIHLGRGEPAKAEQAVGSALRILPGDESLLEDRIDILASLGRTREAVGACRALSRLRCDRRDLDGAGRILRRALEIAPSSLGARSALVGLLEVSGDRAGAAAEVGELVPVILARTRSRPRRAARLLDVLAGRLSKLRQEGATAAVRIADARVELGDREGAVRILSRAGENQIAAGRIADAAHTYSRAVELDPKNLDLAETLALVLARLGSREDALARLRRIAALYRRRGEGERARHAWQEVLRLNPFSPDALLELARMETDRGRKKEAAALLNQLGQLYRAAGDLEAAVQHLDQACRLHPGRKQYVRDLAEALGVALKARHSLETFDELLAMLRARRDHIATLDVAFRMLALDPGHEEAAGALREAYESLGRRLQAALKGREESGADG